MYCNQTDYFISLFSEFFISIGTAPLLQLQIKAVVVQDSQLESVLSR